MRPHVTGESLDSLRKIKEFLDFGVALIRRFEFRTFLNRFSKRDAKFVWHHSGDLIDAWKWNAKRSTNIFDCGARGKGSKRSDLSNVFFAVLFFNVANDIATPFLAKIDVDIGGFQTVFIQKTFEKKVVLDGANMAQVQRVTDQSADTRSTSGGRNSLLPCLADKIPDDQEIVGESKFVDDAQFPLEPIHDHFSQNTVGQHLRVVGIPLFQSFDAKFPQIGFRGGFCRDIVYGKMSPTEFEVDVHRIRDFLATCDRIFQSLELGIHFLGATQVVLVAVHSHSCWIGSELSRIDAQHHVLSFGIFRIDVVTIACCNQRNPKILGQLDGPLHGQTLDVDTVVHDFKEVSLSENLVEPLCDFAGAREVLFHVAGVASQNGLAEFTGDATA